MAGLGMILVAGAITPHGEKVAAKAAVMVDSGAITPHGEKVAAKAAVMAASGAITPHGEKVAAKAAPGGITHHVVTTEAHGNRKASPRLAKAMRRLPKNLQKSLKKSRENRDSPNQALRNSLFFTHSELS